MGGIFGERGVAIFGQSTNGDDVADGATDLTNVGLHGEVNEGADGGERVHNRLNRGGMARYDPTDTHGGAHDRQVSARCRRDAIRGNGATHAIGSTDDGARGGLDGGECSRGFPRSHGGGVGFYIHTAGPFYH